MKTRPANASTRRGSALLAVMWIIALMTMLVGTTALLLTEDVQTIQTRSDMFRARMLAEAGLAIGANPGVKPDDVNLLRREVSPGEGYIVTMHGEDGRLNPNRLLQSDDPNSRGILLNIMKAWGLSLDESQIIIDSLLDWVDQDDSEHMHGAEKKFYNTPGMPFNRPFRTVEEMSLVRGMSEVERRYPNWRDWFSVYASGTLDVNEASAELITAVTGADPMMAQQFVARRAGPDGIPHTKDDMTAPDLPTALRLLGVPSLGTQQGAIPLGVQSSIVRIESVGVVGNFKRKLFAVLNRGMPMAGGGSGLSGGAGIAPVASPPPSVAPVTPGGPAGLPGAPAPGAGMGAVGNTQILWLGEQDVHGDEGPLTAPRRR